MNNKLLIVIAILLIVLVSTLLFSTYRNNSNPQSEKKDTSPQVQSKDPSSARLVIGNPAAPAVLIEYGDFKCPSCNQFHRQAGKQLRDEYIDNGKLRIEFRNLPFIGPDSRRAAEGAFCAADQNKFSAYHDAVFAYMWDSHYSSGSFAAEFEDVLTTEKLSEIASSAGLDGKKLSVCIQKKTHKELVDADLKNSEKDDVTGTPAFLIGGQKISGPGSYTLFKTLVDLRL
jgi:protein-disulfide isomerase